MAEDGHDDVWSKWLLETRFGGDEAARERMLTALRPIRDQVVAGLSLRPGAHVIDVGCGDGMIGFAVLEAEPASTVLFSDFSEPLLDAARSVAAAAGVASRCAFHNADATTLAGIGDGVADGVALRSVLIYVADKAAAFKAFFRVLKPGGQLSLFEPVNAMNADREREGNLWGYRVGPVEHLARKVGEVYERLMPPGDPMLDFNERDLVAQAEDAGFDDIHLQLEVILRRSLPSQYHQTWEQFLNSAGNPKIPTVRDAIRQSLTGEEEAEFVAYLRPLVERGEGEYFTANAFLTAQKPGG
ncbi:MAG: class I SAM-dependent methyltransferase [Dehalococcoidia bacterium]